MYMIVQTPMPMVADNEEGFTFLGGTGTPSDPFACFPGFPAFEDLQNLWHTSDAAQGDDHEAARLGNNYGAALVAREEPLSAFEPLMRAEQVLTRLSGDVELSSSEGIPHTLVCTRFNIATAYLTDGHSPENVRQANEWLDRLLVVWKQIDQYQHPGELYRAVMNLEMALDRVR